MADDKAALGSFFAKKKAAGKKPLGFSSVLKKATAEEEAADVR